MQGKHITQDAAELMAEAMARSELKDARSLTLIERSVEETISFAENIKSVTADIIRDYLMDPYSTLTMMAGKPLFDERSMIIEKEALQLRG